MVISFLSSSLYVYDRRKSFDSPPPMTMRGEHTIGFPPSFANGWDLLPDCRLPYLFLQMLSELPKMAEASLCFPYFWMTEKKRCRLPWKCAILHSTCVYYIRTLVQTWEEIWRHITSEMGVLASLPPAFEDGKWKKSFFCSKGGNLDTHFHWTDEVVTEWVGGWGGGQKRWGGPWVVPSLMSAPKG